MTLIRRITVAALGLAFCIGLFVATSEAQSSWRWSRAQNRGCTQSRYRSWDNNRGRRIGWNNNRLSWRERRRIALMRNRMYDSRGRYYNAGYLTPWQRRRLRMQAYRYRQQNAYRNSYRYGRNL